jgi:hypothetical protein
MKKFILGSMFCLFFLAALDLMFADPQTHYVGTQKYTMHGTNRTGVSAYIVDYTNTSLNALKLTEVQVTFTSAQVYTGVVELVSGTNVLLNYYYTTSTSTNYTPTAFWIIPSNIVRFTYSYAAANTNILIPVFEGTF